ncbi:MULTISPECIES: acyltransferase [Halomonadaceae]|uniref:acyltransferase family protein n=1 Tax=Halomonadaceae TaxID=28256 RepID=UPI001597277D|nr:MULTISPECIES: acyltransferase [Halomonas]QJQ94294.1 acyltransferase [Halomonas sp. PA5]
MNASKERFVGLEWLRFLLGLYIVIFHTLHAYPSIRSWSHYITDVGFFSTSAFFVLSGFLLAHVYLDDQRRMREPPRSFWIKRFSNLYPIHIGALVLAMSLATLIGYLQITPEDADASIRFVLYDVNKDMGENGHLLRHVMGDTELAINLLLNVTLLHAWNPFYLTFNPPSWSISVLFFFYLLFPWLAPRLFRVQHRVRALALTMACYLVPTLVVIVTTDYGMPETGILHRNPLIRLPEFIAGILLCSLYAHYRRQGHSLDRRMGWGLAGFVALSVIAAVQLLQLGRTWYYLLHNGLLLPAQLALIFLAAHWRAPRRDSLKRLASRLGGASLPMFALHVPLYVIFTRIEMVLTGETSLARYPLFLLLTVLFCIFFQEAFVQRIKLLLQRLLLSRKPVAHVDKIAPH